MAREKLPRGWTRPNRDLHFEYEGFHLVVRRHFGGDEYYALMNGDDACYIIGEYYKTEAEAIEAALKHGRAHVKRLARRLGMSLTAKRAKVS